MKEIKGTVTLTRDDGVSSSSEEVVVNDQDKWQAHAALDCDGQEHEYTSRVEYSWLSPDGVEPPGGGSSYEKKERFTC